MNEEIRKTLAEFKLRSNEELLGKGKYGNVFKVTREGDEKGEFALKIIQKELKKRKVYPESLFRNEIAALKSCSHPRIASCTDYFFDSWRYYILMPLLPGTPLSKMSFKDHASVWTIFSQMVDLVALLHKSGFIHRDLKMNNFLVTGNLEVSLLDFNLAIGPTTSTTPHFSYTGTLEFMAPEVAACSSFLREKEEFLEIEPYLREGYTFSADVWSLGVILWKLFEKNANVTQIYDGDTEMIMEVLMFEEEIDFEFEEETPIAAKTLIKQMLTRKPALRPSLQAIQEAISQAEK